MLEGRADYETETDDMQLIADVFKHTYRKFMACMCYSLQCKNMKFTDHKFPVRIFKRTCNLLYSVQ